MEKFDEFDKRNTFTMIYLLFFKNNAKFVGKNKSIPRKN